jgi:hypothetical protein
MTMKTRIARAGLLAAFCGGLVVSYGEARGEVSADCTVKFGADCQICGGYQWAQNYCWSRFADVDLSTVSCDTCHNPGYVQGLCTDYSWWEFDCI